jgi:hypothetical protein
MAQEIADFEPSLAFDGGPFGVRILNRLIQEAPKFIREGGWLAFEVGAGQGLRCCDALSQQGSSSRSSRLRTTRARCAPSWRNMARCEASQLVVCEGLIRVPDHGAERRVASRRTARTAI